jgi:hypothetical protein
MLRRQMHFLSCAWLLLYAATRFGCGVVVLRPLCLRVCLFAVLLRRSRRCSCVVATKHLHKGELAILRSRSHLSLSRSLSLDSRSSARSSARSSRLLSRSLYSLALSLSLSRSRSLALALSQLPRLSRALSRLFRLSRALDPLALSRSLSTLSLSYSHTLCTSGSGALVRSLLWGTTVSSEGE